MPREKELSRRAQWAGAEPITNALMARALENPDLISLAAAFIDQSSLPAEPVKEAFDAIWADPDEARAALQYGTTIGFEPLRKAICRRLTETDGAVAEHPSNVPEKCAPEKYSPEQMVITSGSNELLYLLADSILDPGDIVLCGAPSYFVFLGSLANLGCQAIGIKTDAKGMIPESLEATLVRLRDEDKLDLVKAIYVISYFDNPTGVNLSIDRRKRLVEIAQRFSTSRRRLRIIEDVAYRDLLYEGADLPSIRSFDAEGETVIMIGSFSKSFSPGLRVGWGLFPSDLLKPVLSQKGHINFGSPHFSQTLMAKVLETGQFDRHLQTLQAAYREKLLAFDSAAEEHLRPLPGVTWNRPTGGLYVWLELPEGIEAGTESPLFAQAVKEGVLYVPGELCYPGPVAETPKNCLRLSFGVPPAPMIQEGIAALGRALKAVLPLD